MSDSRLTVTIDGREAVPVRALPYVLDWNQMTPLDVAMHFAKRHGPPFNRFSNMHAYRLRNGKPHKLLPREWDAVVTKLNGYQDKLQHQHNDGARGEAVWNKKAARKLPSGIFVWLDELEQDSTDAQKVVSSLADVREGDAEVVLSPWIEDDATVAMVREGFEPANAQQAEANPESPNASDLKKLVAVETAADESKQAAPITKHLLKTRSNPLDAVIELATKSALAPGDAQSVWAELVRMAETEKKPAPLIGFSSDGIQYRGNKFEETGEPDTFKKSNLRDRMARAKKR